VHVQPRLALIAILAILIRPVVVLMAVIATMVVAVMMVVTMMRVIFAAVRVAVNEKPRERAGRRGIGHAEGWRQSKHGRHRPNQGDPASACSLQRRQHALRTRTPPRRIISGRHF
jgi:hypothetical protein